MHINWTNILYFIAEFGFDISIFLLLLRILLKIFYVPSKNAIASFVFKNTLLTKLLGKIIPPWRNLDTSALLLILILEFTKIIILSLLQFHAFPIAAWIFATPLCLAQIFSQLINLWFIALFLRVIMEWMELSPQIPLFAAIICITEFMLKPMRRFLPISHPIDLPAIIMGILLKLVDVAIFSHIIEWSELHLVKLLLQY